VPPLPAAPSAATLPGSTAGAAQPASAAAVDAQAAPRRHVSVTLVAGEPLAVLRAVEGEASVAAALLIAGQPLQTLALPPAAGSGGWVTACAAGAVRWLGYGSASELRIARAQAGTAAPLTAASAELGEPIDASDVARDRVILLCTEQLARVLYVDQAKALRQITCSASECSAPLTLAAVVQQLSAVQRQDVTLVSFYEGPLAPTIKLLRLDAAGKPLGPAVVAGSCWEPLGGLCGASTLVGDAQRVALLTRDGPDLLALESVNTGRSWGVLSGFQQRAPTSSGSDPMQQHRLRKGLEE